MLKALVGSDVLIQYVPFGMGKREEHYKLSDCFCWFWIHFKDGARVNKTDYWQQHLHESDISAWRGIAFEEVCLQHVPQIKAAMQIAGVASKESSLIVKGNKDTEGMQIDLLIDRADDVVNVCEMKYSKVPFSVTKAYSEKMSKRLATLEGLLPEKTFHMTLITINGLERNEHSDIFTTVLSADDLFK